MSNQFLKLRRSAVPGRVPSTSSIDFGEIALNTYDGLAFIKRSGSLGEEVITLGSREGAFTGSFSGSFVGNGGGLFNIPASGIVGLNLSQIATGSVTASVNTGTGSFSLVSGSSTFLFVSSSGNVGIGTNTTTAKMHISGSDTQVLLRVQSPSVFNGIAQSNILHVNGYGEIGIGATPYSQVPLYVYRSTYGDLARFTGDGGTVAITGGSAIYIGSLSIAKFSTSEILLSNSVGNAVIRNSYAGPSAGMAIQAPGNIILSPGTFDGSGNLGIGLASPTSKVHISGSSQGLFEIDSNTIANILYVSSSGNVGIGTNTPNATLTITNSEVVGTAASSYGLNINANQTTTGAGGAIKYGILVTPSGTFTKNVGTEVYGLRVQAYSGTVYNNYYAAASFADRVLIGTQNPITQDATTTSLLNIGNTVDYSTYNSNPNTIRFHFNSPANGLIAGIYASQNFTNVAGGIFFKKDIQNGSSDIDFVTAATNVQGTLKARLFSTGNFRIQDAGTFIDSGDRLQVSGSSRFVGDMVITGSGNTSATTALTVRNSSGATIFSARNDGLVLASTVELTTLQSSTAFPRIIMGGASVSGTDAASFKGILFGTNVTSTISSGNQSAFLLGNNISVSSGGGSFNYYVIGSGISGNPIVGLHNHIMMGTNSNVPTFVITPANGAGTTGGASLGLASNYNTSTWSVKGITGSLESDKVQQASTGTSTVLNIRRNDGLAAGTFWARVNIGTLIEVNSVRTFVTSTSTDTINVTTGIPATASVLYNINVSPSIVTWLKQDNTFGANINYFGNLVIGINPSNNETSLLQLNSTTKGFLLPRMTQAQRVAIASPAQGLLVYDTGSLTEGLWYYNSGSNPGWQGVLTNSGSQTISGSITANNITVTGTLTAQTIVAQTITSSTDYVSGSTIFGNSLSNTHQFTGSVSITGSLRVNGGSVPLGSGVTGQVTYWDSANNITGSSNLVWDAANNRLGINSTPGTGNSLHVAGNTFSNTISTNGGINLNRNGDEANLQFQRDGIPTAQLRALNGGGFRITGPAAGTEWARFHSTGNFSIGSTSDSGERLQVAGSTRLAGNTFVSGTLDILDAEINYQRNNNVTTGSARLIASIPTASLNAAFFDYVIVSGSNARAGTVTSVWVSSSVEWNETYTNDIGSTSDVTLYSAITGSSIGLFATSSINNVWTIKSLIRTI